jgi:NADH:ubiquinone oxidoreductase subunit 2 (subunit N)
MIAHEHMTLVIIMILTSAIGAVYYLKLIAHIFTPIENAGRIMISDSMRRTFIVLSLLTIVLFFAASLLEVI